MADRDDLTPPPSDCPTPVLAEKVRQLQERVSGVKATLVEHDRLLVELAGRSGREGQLGELRKDLGELQGNMDGLAREVRTLTERLHGLRRKLAIAVAAAAGAGAAGADVLLRLVGAL